MGRAGDRMPESLGRQPKRRSVEDEEESFDEWACRRELARAMRAGENVLKTLKYHCTAHQYHCTARQ